MQGTTEGKIVICEDDKKLAIYSLDYSMAMARIRSVFKKSLRRARAKISARNKEK